MAEITNEQKLYVLLDNIRDKSEYEQEIWGIIYDHVSPDDAWKEDVARLLVKSEYLNRGYAYCNQESRVVYSVTKQEVKTLEKESSFKEQHGVIYKIMWMVADALIGAIVGSVVTYIVLKQR